MSDADEKRAHHLAERKGFRLDKVGAAEDRFYVIDVASGAKLPSDVPGHPYSFTLKEAREWLEAAHQKGSKAGRKR